MITIKEIQFKNEQALVFYEHNNLVRCVVMPETNSIYDMKCLIKNDMDEVS